MKLQKPYYAVIFTNKKHVNTEGYDEMAALMEELARKQVGYLGFESAREEIGISVSYWESLEAIACWKDNVQHKLAQQKGKENWYAWYKVKICLVEREYDFHGETH